MKIMEVGGMINFEYTEAGIKRLATSLLDIAVRNKSNTQQGGVHKGK